MTILHNPNSVKLNGVNYPLTGQVRPTRTAVMPPKTVIGDYSIETDPEISSWVINDQRGGLGVERMDPKRDTNRCWFSNCNLDQKGHITLPRQASQIARKPLGSVEVLNPGIEDFPPGQGGIASNWNNLPRSTGYFHSGVASGHRHVTWSYGWPSYWSSDTPLSSHQVFTVATGMAYTATGWIKARAHAGQGTWKARLLLSDSAGSAASSEVVITSPAEGVSETDWVELSCTYTPTALNRQLKLHLDVLIAQTTDNPLPAGAVDFYWDDITLIETDQPALAGPFRFANYNNRLYLSSGPYLWRLSDAPDINQMQLVAKAGTSDITALVPSLNNSLYIFLGDTENYVYMSTDEQFTQTNVHDATLGCQWDNKLFKMNSSGKCWYATTPNSTTPAWTETGNITDLPAGAIKRLSIGFDSNGNSCLYAATTRGAKVLDFEHNTWLDTSVSLGDHPNGGRGAGTWRDAYYIPAGLELLRYAAIEAQVTAHGLTNDDGLPEEHNGEIVDMATDYVGRLFALVDASQVSGEGRSGVYAFDGTSWHNWWTADSVDGVMHSAVVSPASGQYRLYYDHASSVFAVAVPRGANNPKLASAEYAPSGVHITPWFDAGWAQGTKTALKVILRAVKPTDLEDVKVYYRTDYTDTALDTGWTLLGSVTDTGETSFAFGSGAGISFKSIQFRFSLTSASNPAVTPDIEWFALLFRVLPNQIDPLNGGWGYRFTVDCSRPYNGKSESQLIDALFTAANSTALVELAFRYDTGGTETYLGIVKTVDGQTQTGILKEGLFEVFVVVP